MKVKIFSHSADPDGIGCVILSKLAFEDVEVSLNKDVNELNNNLLEFLNETYLHKNYSKIFITDLCPSLEILQIIKNNDKLSNKILILDHHTSAFKSLNENGYVLPFVKVWERKNNIPCCGASLFYDYLINQNLLSKENNTIKKFIELTHLHDTWEWKKENNLDAFNLEILFQKLGGYGYMYHFYEKCLKEKEFVYNEEENKWIIEQNRENEKNILNLINNIIVTKEDDCMYGMIIGFYKYRNIIAEKLKIKRPELDILILLAIDNNTISFRSLKDKPVLELAKYYDGSGHEKAASSPLTKENEINLIRRFLK